MLIDMTKFVTEVKCKPGSTTFDECGNLCTCNEAGVTICTRRGCKTATS